MRVLSCKMCALDYETKTLTFSILIFTLLPMLYCRKEKRLMSGYWSNFVCFNSILIIIANSYPLDTGIQHINILVFNSNMEYEFVFYQMLLLFLKGKGQKGDGCFTFHKYLYYIIIIIIQIHILIYTNHFLWEGHC